jgi:hypothetical protein
VCCVVRAVHKLIFRLVINETPNKWQPVCFKLYHAGVETHVIYISTLTIVTSVMGLTLCTSAAFSSVRDFVLIALEINRMY